jgi:hypothetical protein
MFAVVGHLPASFVNFRVIPAKAMVGNDGVSEIQQTALRTRSGSRLSAPWMSSAHEIYRKSCERTRIFYGTG